MTSIQTTDINGNTCQFQYEFNKEEFEEDLVHFRFYTIPKNEMRWFSYSFKIINKDIAKGEVATNNNNVEFSKKGLPEKIIEIASIRLNRDIISSPIIPEAGNYLVSTSFKAWERLVQKNKNALMDKKNNYFILKRT